jgi:hypothetical protein
MNTPMMMLDMTYIAKWALNTKMSSDTLVARAFVGDGCAAPSIGLPFHHSVVFHYSLLSSILPVFHFIWLSSIPFLVAPQVISPLTFLVAQLVIIRSCLLVYNYSWWLMDSRLGRPFVGSIFPSVG